MCTNYTPTAREQIESMRLGVGPLPDATWAPEAFPGYLAPLVLSDAAGQANRCVLARFGLVPRWSKDAKTATDIARHTYNARSETVAEKPSYRSPWRERHYALAPMRNFFEPCWEDAGAHGGKSERWRISVADGQPFAAAALWERWTDPASAEIVTSFTLITVNAQADPVMRRMHGLGDEKRSIVIVAPADYQAWLHATPAQATALLRRESVAALLGEPAPRKVQGLI
ncbi:MAG: SOS response-associated peptidase family protein [Betaproteobacteria bacterium]